MKRTQNKSHYLKNIPKERNMQGSNIVYGCFVFTPCIFLFFIRAIKQKLKMDTKQQEPKQEERSIFITEPINYVSRDLAQSLYECVLNNIKNDLTDLQLDDIWQKASSRSFQITFLKSILT